MHVWLPVSEQWYTRTPQISQWRLYERIYVGMVHREAMERSWRSQICTCFTSLLALSLIMSKIGSVPTPWPSWVIAAHVSEERAPSKKVREFTAALTEYVGIFDSDESRAKANVDYIKETFGYPEADIMVSISALSLRDFFWEEKNLSRHGCKQFDILKIVHQCLEKLSLILSRSSQTRAYFYDRKMGSMYLTLLKTMLLDSYRFHSKSICFVLGSAEVSLSAWCEWCHRPPHVCSKGDFSPTLLSSFSTTTRSSSETSRST